MGEGFNRSRLGVIEQYVGRLRRLHEGKREVRVYDYVDSNVPMLARMYAKRHRGYRAMGYSCQEPTHQLELPNGKTASGLPDRIRSK